jgi:hypothetical protein
MLHSNLLISNNLFGTKAGVSDPDSLIPGLDTIWIPGFYNQKLARKKIKAGKKFAAS